MCREKEKKKLQIRLLHKAKAVMVALCMEHVYLDMMRIVHITHYVRIYLTHCQCEEEDPINNRNACF